MKFTLIPIALAMVLPTIAAPAAQVYLSEEPPASQTNKER